MTLKAIAPAFVALPPNHVEVELYAAADLGKEPVLREDLPGYYLDPSIQEEPDYGGFIAVVRAGPAARAGGGGTNALSVAAGPAAHATKVTAPRARAPLGGR